MHSCCCVFLCFLRIEIQNVKIDCPYRECVLYCRITLYVEYQKKSKTDIRLKNLFVLHKKTQFLKRKFDELTQKRNFRNG